MIKVRRILGVILSLMLVLSVLAGCGNSDSTDKVEETTAAETEVVTEVTEGNMDKKLEIEWLSQNAQGLLPKEDTAVKNKLEEMFNIEIKDVPIDIYNKDQVNVYFATGETPDVIFYGESPQKLYDMGVIREFSLELVEKYAPNFKKILDAEGDWLRYAVYKGSSSDKLISIPSVNVLSMVPIGMITRKDWMDKVGVTKIPETLVELEELFLKYRNNDPDGNGIKDTYALSKFETKASNFGSSFSYVLGAFNIPLGEGLKRMIKKEDGTLSYYMLEDGYKEALKVLADWYKKEIFDPELLLDTRKELGEKFKTGKLGAYEGNNAWLQATAQTPIGKLLEQDPKVVPVYLPPVKGPEGHVGTVSFKVSSLTEKPGIFFGANTSDEKVIRILQMIERIYSDMELYSLVEYGVKDEHYTIDNNGVAQPKQEFTSKEKITEIGIQRYYQRTFISSNLLNYRLPPERKVAVDELINFSLLKNILNYSPTGETITEVKAALVKIETELLWKAVAGEIDIEAEFDTYKQKWLDAGGQKVLDYMKSTDSSLK